MNERTNGDVPRKVNALVRPCFYAGTEIMPQDGDIVEWISNGERWVVSRADDLEGPAALHHWDDGGWCNVRLIHRPNRGIGGK